MLRKRSRVALRILTFVSILGLQLGSVAAYQDTIIQTFEVAAGGDLRIRAERGSIDVRSGEATDVFIEIIPKGSLRDASDIEDEFEVRFDQSGNQVTLDIESRRSGGWGWLSFKRSQLEIRVEVPSRFNADLRTSGGSISVDDLQGDVRSTTSGGSLSFGRIEGPVYGRTSGGSIRLTESIGDADVKTSGGSITIGDVDGNVEAVTSGGSIKVARAAGRVVARTSGGGISVDDVSGSIDARTSGGSVRATISAQPEGDCRLSTSGGSVTVNLASNISFRVDAKASGGRVRSDLAVNARSSSKTTLRGDLNGGGPDLVLRTSGGGIQIGRLR